MNRTAVLAAAVAVVVAGTAAAWVATRNSAAPPRAATSPPTPPPGIPFEGPTPIELRFCSADEAIFRIQSRVAYGDPPLSRSMSQLAAARRIAAREARFIRRRDEPELARRVFAWSRSFDRSAALLVAGTEPLDALEPAIERRNEIEEIFTCELDA